MGRSEVCRSLSSLLRRSFSRCPPPPPPPRCPFSLSRAPPLPRIGPTAPGIGAGLARSYSVAPLGLVPRPEELPSGRSGSRLDPEEQGVELGRIVPVKAYFICTGIDLKELQNQNSNNVISINSRARNYVVLRLWRSDLRDARIGSESGLANESGCCYMVVFQYGSVVLFNVSDYEVDRCLKIVEKHTSGMLSEMRKDDYAVSEKPNLETWMQPGKDSIMLKSLNIDGIHTIGSVLGQSIALDYYNRQVDDMIEEFTDINRGMEKTGTFNVERKKLFQLVGKANSNLADVILKLRLFERSDIAWRNANYDEIWDYLRNEYELEQRFESFDIKKKFVEQNILFLQEILQNRKSDKLEWCIIILISVEILITIFR